MSETTVVWSSVSRNPVLTGKRLKVRTFVQEDISDAYIGWLRDPEVTRYSNQRFRRHDDASSKSYFDSFANSHNRFLLIEKLEDESALGTLTVYVAPPHGTADIGIMVGEKSVWGRGYGQEAWDLVVEWLMGEASIRKITAGTLALNKGMVRLLERSGMHLEATRYGQEVVDGQPADIVYYARFNGG